MLHFLAAAALGAASPVCTSLTAHVNDARSHGLVGDALLSLDEAIQLANGSLPMAQLSAAELGQLSGSGTLVDCIAVDPTVTPVINLERPLTMVTGTASGPVTMLTITGMATGMPPPVLDGGSQAVLLGLRTHMVQVMGLLFRGGQVGIDLRTTMGSMAPGGMAMVMDCRFESQTVACMQITAGGTGETTASMTLRSSFRNAPVGIRIDDQSNMGGVLTEDEQLDFDGVATAYDITGNGRLNLSMNMVFRSRMRNGATFLRLVRGTQSTQQQMVRITHCDAVGTGDLVDVQGTAAGLTMVHHHHSRFETGTGNHAFWIRPRTALFDIHGSEDIFVGKVSIAANLFTQRLWQQGNRYRNCTYTLDSDGAPPNLLWNRYESSAIVVPATARAAARFRSCELDNTSVSGNSLLAPITLDGCHRVGGSLAGQVAEVNVAPARFLGAATVTPPDPQLGATLALQTDLPFGVGAFWDIAVSYPRPNTAAEPYRFYGDPAAMAVLPGMVVFRNRTDVPVPNNAVLAGLEFYAQPVVVPLLGQAWVPVVTLPPGGLFRLRP